METTKEFKARCLLRDLITKEKSIYYCENLVGKNYHDVIEYLKTNTREKILSYRGDF